MLLYPWKYDPLTPHVPHRTQLQIESVGEARRWLPFTLTAALSSQMSNVQSRTYLLINISAQDSCAIHCSSLRNIHEMVLTYHTENQPPSIVILTLHSGFRPPLTVVLCCSILGKWLFSPFSQSCWQLFSLEQKRRCVHD